MKLIKYMFICAISVFAAVSCNGKKDMMSPESVTETFCRAVAAGDFETAGALCDTVSMKDYLDNYRMVMNSLQKEDSCALIIAASMLSDAEFEVSGIEKKGEERIVRYRLKIEGNTKEKKATLAKREGEWKVKAITDAI